MTTYCIEKRSLTGDAMEKLEVTADSAIPNEEGTRVTFYDADSNPVAGFINVHAWYPKPEGS